MKTRKVKTNGAIIPMILSLGILVLPLVFWPWAAVPYEIPRVWFVQRWIEALVVTGMIWGLPTLRRRHLDSWLIGSVIMFGLWAVATAVTGVDSPKSLAGNYYRGDGLITLFHLIGLFLFLALFWQSTWSRLVSRAIKFGALAASVWASGEAIRLFLVGDRGVGGWGGAVGASFGQPNFLAGYLLVTLPFMLPKIEGPASTVKRGEPASPTQRGEPASPTQRGESHPSVAGIVRVTLPLVAIGLTRSWAAVILAGLYLVVWLWLTYRTKMARLAGLILAISVATLAPLWVIRTTRQGFLPEGRERIVRSILRGVVSRPIVGWGWANVDYAFEFNPWPMRFTPDVYVDKAHGILLEVLTTTGIVGLGLYGYIVWRIGRLLIFSYRLSTGEDKQWQLFLLMAFLLFLFHSQTNVIGIGEEVFFWLLAGIMASERCWPRVNKT